MNKNFILAAASLIGTIIGAGIFGVPYVISRAGLIPSLFYFILLGAVVMFLHLFFGEIILRTKGKYRLPGYAEKYLGSKAKTVVAAATIVGIVGALLAYIILLGKFASLLLPFSDVYLSIFIWLLLSLLVGLGIKTIAPVELWMNLVLFAVFLIIFAFCLPRVQISNFLLVSGQDIFLPFGVVLFSLMGTSAVPEALSLLKKKKDFKKVVVLTTFATVSFTLLFGLIVSGVSGLVTSQESFEGLKLFLGRGAIALGGLFGLLAVATSFLVLANYLKNSLRLDYKVPRFLALVVAVCFPMALFLIGFRQFIAVIGIVGTFLGLVEGFTIVLLFRKAKKQGEKKPGYNIKANKFMFYFIIIVLVLGALSQLIYG